MIEKQDICLDYYPNCEKCPLYDHCQFSAVNWYLDDEFIEK